MKKNNILNIQNFSTILIITFISIFYSIPFFSDLSRYGALLLGAGLINGDFILYQDWFDHKGPIIYGFEDYKSYNWKRHLCNLFLYFFNTYNIFMYYNLYII